MWVLSLWQILRYPLDITGREVEEQLDAQTSSGVLILASSSTSLSWAVMQSEWMEASASPMGRVLNIETHFQNGPRLAQVGQITIPMDWSTIEYRCLRKRACYWEKSALFPPGSLQNQPGNWGYLPAALKHLDVCLFVCFPLYEESRQHIIAPITFSDEFSYLGLPQFTRRNQGAYVYMERERTRERDRETDSKKLFSLPTLYLLTPYQEFQSVLLKTPNFSAFNDI